MHVVNIVNDKRQIIAYPCTVCPTDSMLWVGLDILPDTSEIPLLPTIREILFPQGRPTGVECAVCGTVWGLMHVVGVGWERRKQGVEESQGREGR